MELLEKIEDYKKEIDGADVSTNDALEAFRIQFLGSKNILKDLYKELKNIPNDSKKEVGQAINSLKKQAENKFEKAKRSGSSIGVKKKKLDLSRPADYVELGARHPLSVIRK